MNEIHSFSFDPDSIARKTCVPGDELKKFLGKEIQDDRQIAEIIEHVMHCSNCVFRLYKLYAKVG